MALDKASYNPATVQVAIKLSGSEYRTLVSELEYHWQNLKEELNRMPSNAFDQRHTVSRRLDAFKTVQEKVAS